MPSHTVAYSMSLLFGELMHIVLDMPVEYRDAFAELTVESLILVSPLKSIEGLLHMQETVFELV